MLRWIFLDYMVCLHPIATAGNFVFDADAIDQYLVRVIEEVSGQFVVHTYPVAEVFATHRGEADFDTDFGL